MLWILLTVVVLLLAALVLMAVRRSRPDLQQPFRGRATGLVIVGVLLMFVAVIGLLTGRGASSMVLVIIGTVLIAVGASRRGTW